MVSSGLLRYAAILGLAGCGRLFELEPPVRGDGAIGLDPDGDSDSAALVDSDLTQDSGTAFVALHVPAGGQSAGTGDLAVAATIDTTSLQIDGAAPAGVTFDSWPQVGGPDLAVLHVRRFRISAGTTVRVIGSRPLVVIASHEITISGILDAGARRAAPGAGGSAADVGSGKGGVGLHASTFRDSGGGGGGFGAAGGMGGQGGFGCTPVAAGGQGGAIYGTSSSSALVGGSGGGTGYATSCPSESAGAGGGAVQLSSATSVTVTGRINSGGGGGGAGQGEGCVQLSAGSGGGSGGLIVLQAPVIQGAGGLAANGGAGGSAGGDSNGDSQPPFTDGLAGQDGQVSTSQSTPGADVGQWSAVGGAGGAASLSAQDGGYSTSCEGNGGGGGGGVGRIVIATPTGASAVLSGIVSPLATAITY